MRKILFRGKTEQLGDWIEGSLVIGRDLESGQLEYLIAPLSAYYTEVKKVMPETVGQYTGLTDNNGTKIFEGDVGRYKQTDGAKINGNPIICIGKVVYNEKTVSFAIDSKDEIGAKNYDYFPIKDFEIIGNIHDNPGLLGNE